MAGRLALFTVVAAIAAPVPPAAGVASSAEPSLRLVAGGAVTVERRPGAVVRLDPGTRVVAGRVPFEVRATRASYVDPVVATRLVGNRRVRLPAGLVADLAGFRAFTHLTLLDAAGNTVIERDETFCPNGTPVRTHPEAPPTSPYPRRCATFAPFALGGVWGIQAGWGAPTAARWNSPLFLDDGSYTAVVSVNQPYRELFGFAPDAWSASVPVTVRTVDASTVDTESSGGPLRPAAQRPSTTMRPPRGPRPDLRPLPAFNIYFTFDEAGRDRLAFAATVWTAGTSPLVVDAFRRPGEAMMDAYQYFYDTRGGQVGSARVGTMEWDAREGHNHWHFTDFAQYRLLDADKRVAVRSGKEAFCLASTDPIDQTLPHANWHPENTDLHSSCGDANAEAVRQVLDIGNGDTYHQDLPGQSFDVTDLPNGVYHIEIVANPERALHEHDTANNVSHRRIVIGGTPGDRTVEVPPHGLVDA
jgi:hypothetical protein